MDNLETHKSVSLYETFSAEEAKALWDWFEFIYTPKHWLNMAEIELNVLLKQCLGRKIDEDMILRYVRCQEEQDKKEEIDGKNFTLFD